MKPRAAQKLVVTVVTACLLIAGVALAATTGGRTSQGDDLVVSTDRPVTLPAQETSSAPSPSAPSTLAATDTEPAAPVTSPSASAPIDDSDGGSHDKADSGDGDHETVEPDLREEDENGDDEEETHETEKKRD